jgi:hypothetical protein
MKNVLTILFCLLTLAALSQTQPRKKYKGAIPNEASGYSYKTIIGDSAIGLPRYPYKLDTGQVKYLGRQGDALMFADTLAGRIYWYNPAMDSVLSVGSGDGNTVTNFYSNGSTAKQFSDTIKYFSDGSLTDIKFFMGKKAVTNIRTMTENGSGFLPTSGQTGDSVHVYYPIAPYDTVWYILSGSYADTNVLAQPTGLIATPLNATKMLLTFNNVQHNNGYELYYGFTGGTYQYAATLDKDDTTYEHSGLPPDTKVFWEVRALGDSAWYGSNFSYTSARTEALVPIQTPSITATANSGTQITVNWDPVAHASRYVLIYSTDATFYTVLDSLSSSTTSYINDSLSTGTRIWYQLQALGDDSVYSNSVYSDTVSAITHSLPAIATPNLIIDSTQRTSVYMHWNSITGATGYLLQYSTDNLNWVLAGTTPSDTTFFVHSNLSPGRLYYYQLQALGNSITTDNSLFDDDTATTQPDIIPLLRTPTFSLTVVSPNKIRANWGDLQNEVSYILQKSLDGTTWTTIATPAQNVITYTDSNLTAATIYYYRVQGVGDGVNFKNSPFNTKNATTLSLTPLAATTVTATKTGTNSIHTSWNAIANATAYQLEYSLNGSTFTIIDTLTTIFYDHAQLNENTKYYYRVKVLGDGTAHGNSAYSNVANATTDSTVVTGQTLPTPTGLHSTVNSTTQITVAWNDIAGETFYQLERSTNKTTWSVLPAIAPNVTTSVNPGLTPNTKYYFRLLAVGNGTTTTNSEYTAIDSATTSALITLTTPALTATPASSSSNTLSWTNVANESNYTLQYSPDKSTWTTIATPAANVTTFTHTGLNASTKYYYQIRANGDGITYTNSAFDVDSATTQVALPVPLDSPNVDLTVFSPNRIDANWDAVNNATGYKVDRSLNGSAWTNVATLSSAVTTYSSTGLQPATKYWFRVQATSTNAAYTNSNYTVVTATTQDTSTSTIVHGVMLNGGNVNAAKIGLNNLGVNVIRTAYDGKGANYTAYTDQFKTLWNYNPQRPGEGLPMPTDSAQFACTLDSMLTENGTHNLIGIAIINEPVNVGYWTDNISASNYLKLLQSCVNVGRRRGIAVYDGGISGNLKLYEVWWDFMQRGLKDSADNFEALAFNPGTNVSNWRASSNFGPRIRFLDTLIAGLKNIPTDAVNLHYYETIRDVDSNKTSVSEEALLETVRYYSRATGKPVITNEYGLNNTNSTGIQTGLLKALKAAHVKIALYYGPDILTNPDGSLTPLGTNYKNTIAQP